MAAPARVRVRRKAGCPPAPRPESGRAAGFAALAQAGRLEIFRLLVNTVDGGLTAAQIAAMLSLRHNLVSSQLRILVCAGLVTARQENGAVQFRPQRAMLKALFDFSTDFSGGS